MNLRMSLPQTLFLSLTLIFAGHALAERADRDKPIALEADKVTIDDIKRVQTLEGNVILTQGTLTIHSDRIVVTEDTYGFQHGIAFGGPNGLARFKQKRDGVDTWIEGEGERIEYNTKTEVAEFFHRAWIKSGEDQLKGEYIWYDAISERYLASAGENSLKKPSRVRAIIQPKTKDAPVSPTTPRPSGLQLKTTEGISLPDRP